MRPLRIELEGFSAYRTPVEVDFAGADFFSLTGPTGSGKSSLIDAMIFALFGRVPRLGGNAVAPVITAGADQARVRLDFESNSQVYSVVRMAVRTASGGATVREARLEQGDRVLASGADDVTREVEGLLKLRFEDFTRTVVLPQGDFARFLTATKAERQSLLRNLLGLDPAAHRDVFQGATCNFFHSLPAPFGDATEHSSQPLIIDATRQDRVRADVERTQFTCQVAREAFDRDELRNG